MPTPTTLPIPDFYKPKQTEEVYIERAALVATAAEEYRKRYGIEPAKRDRERIALFVIDGQVGFCTPGASLFVPGAPEDSQRTLAWAYANMARLTSVHFSMDTHRVFQIFHPAMWVDKDGRHPAPFTLVTEKDVVDGNWRPVAFPREALEYVRKLSASGKYVLTIWPYHTLLGGVSHALVPPLMELGIFHATARQAQTHFETKGTHALTENYSVMSPEVKQLGGQVVGEFNTAFFQLVMAHDRVYVAGQAKSHCVMETLNDMLRHMKATDPALVQRLYVLEDCMSPVPAPPGCGSPGHPANFPEVATRRFTEFLTEGIRLVKSTDPVA